MRSEIDFLWLQDPKQSWSTASTAHDASSLLFMQVAQEWIHFHKLLAIATHTVGPADHGRKV